MFGDMRSEDEKLAMALEMAFNEISKDKSEGVDEETAAANTQTKELRKKGYLGTHAMIKLPYIIGTPEFQKHPYAGLVYLGMENLEQDELHKDEQNQLKEDKAHEQEVLYANAEEQARLDNLR